jgi:hypothetical protein
LAPLKEGIKALQDGQARLTEEVRRLHPPGDHA